MVLNIGKKSPPKPVPLPKASGSVGASASKPKPAPASSNKAAETAKKQATSAFVGASASAGGSAGAAKQKKEATIKSKLKELFTASKAKAKANTASKSSAGPSPAQASGSEAPARQQAAGSASAPAGARPSNAAGAGSAATAAPAAPGATAASGATATQAAARRDIQLDVPFYSQVSGGPQAPGVAQGSTACFDTAKAMAKANGATVLGSNERIQVATAEDAKGRVTADPARAQEGRNYIDSQLEAGRPVVAGVSHRDGTSNVDGITDHFVTITGRGTDENGKQYYTFLDPGTAHRDKAEGRFYVDEQSGNLYRPGAEATGSVVNRRFEVSMIRKNAEAAN
jgi:hypothetical protein